MRQTIPDLVSPRPIGTTLPGVYQGDDFTRRLTDAFDVILAPIFCTLDNVEAYSDVMLAPEDFVVWLAGWVGLAIDENWTPEFARYFASQMPELYRWRGTRRGLSRLVELYAGVVPDIEESGAVGWSARPEAEPPGAPTPSVVVRVPLPAGTTLAEDRLTAVIVASAPAHIPHRVEVVAP